MLCIAIAILGLLQSMAARYLARHLADQLAIPALLAVMQHAERGHASLQAVLADIETVRDTLSGFVGRALVSIVMTPFLIPLTFAIHWAFGFVIALFCLAMALISLGLVCALNQRQEVAAASTSRIYNLTLDAMRSGEAVLAMGMLPRLGRLWVKQGSKSAREIWHADEKAARLRFLSDLTVGFFRGALLFTMFGLPFFGATLHGAFAGAAILVGQVASPFGALGQTIDRWTEATAAWHRLRRLADNTAQASAPGLAFPCPESRLVAEHLSFTFGGNQPFLFRNVDLAVEPGQTIAILGGSGSGKSTLLRLLLGLHRPSAGGIYLDGHATSQWDRRDLARHVGYLPQQPLLARGTLAEVIARLEQPDMDLVLDAARRAGAHEIIAGLPLGYATPVAGNYQFSMGQRHRIAIARALYGRPRLLLLDELAGSLDAEGETEIVALLARLQQEGSSVVFTTHRPALLRMANRVLTLRNGTLVPAGGELHRLPAAADAAGRRLA
ncbi:ATP-binding cassette domain-containing protein [Belnapia sp. T18]|uniref:ATP-binding cassette domain-containing protein n=1 Tax=Belnapia arida TaxID=2804533 RepID=A0ABS1UFX9_9PROT|nr:ATP-binding cassette domain-containing protein [Belnapia arida]MBL6082612.1 ATP-binding cassette domain-containing protein [Belnapia arida]